MRDENKTKALLITELKQMRRRVSELEKTEPLHKQADKALQESDTKFSSIFYALSDGICFHELIYNDNKDAVDYRILDVNPQYEKILALKKEDVINKLASEIYGADEPPYLETYAKVAQTGKSIQFETYFPPMDRHFSIAVFSPDKDQFATIFEDITDRKRSEEELRRSEERYRTFITQSTDGVWCVELDAPCPIDLPESEQIRLIMNNRIVECNNAMARMYSFQSAEEMIGRSLSDFISEEGAGEIIQMFIHAGYRITGVETEEVDQFGKRRHFISTSFGIIVDGSLVRFWGTQQDGLSHKRAEEALRESEQNFRDMVENLLDGVAITDENTYHLYVNPKFSEITGYSKDELLNMTGWDFTRPEDLAQLKQRMKDRIAGKPHQKHYERIIVRKDGTEVPTEMSTTTTIWQGKKCPMAIIRNITERKQAEEEKAKLEKQLRRAQKLETVGTLAGGIAHDFNNALTPIIGYTDMALSDLPPSNPLYDDLKQVMAGANRAKDLVQQILTFSRKIEQERKTLKLHVIVKEAIKLLRPSIPSTIEIRQRIDTTCEKVLAEASQMHQVFINLCTNSFHAMEKEGGVLTIELKQVEVDAVTAQFHPSLEQKEYVRLTVSDTGPGMDDATLDRIFEPFFTTKAVDRGTGLGLSVVHGIVRSHHGDIIVYSEPGKGSTFHVYIPISTATGPGIDIKRAKTIQGGQEHILVVDDEKSVVTMLKRMLERFGYEVEARKSSIEALKAFREQPERYDLAISDLTMPNMTGLELAKELHNVRPELPVIIMTGYGENIAGDILEHYGINKIVGKPIEMQKLAVAIRKVIDK